LGFILEVTNFCDLYLLSLFSDNFDGY